MGISGVLVSLVLLLLSIIVLIVRRQYSFWKIRGIPHDKPIFIVGNLRGFFNTRHMRDIMKENYTKFKDTGPFGGFYFFLKPMVVVYDLDLAKDILIRDFYNFTDRGVFHNELDDPLTGHLFALDGQKWKNLRTKLSPTFTSGKMKFMFPTVLSSAEQLLVTFGRMTENDPVIEMKDILARFTVDVIGSCAFGLECNSLHDPDAEFRVMGGKAFTLLRHPKIIHGLCVSFPDLAKKLRMRQIHEDVHHFFMGIVRETVKFREKHSIKRNDFMNLLIELKHSGEGMTIEEIAAQAFIFFVAGFETTSTTMGFAFYELAYNQEIQDKLRAEINLQFKKHNGKFPYECMAEMHYLKKVFKETLRKYSVTVNIVRKSLNDYPTSNPKYTIPKGVMIAIPADAIHRDPEIYPDPEKFDPERFSPEEAQKRHTTTWLPFGDGPRHCIGLRFGKMQTYIGLAMLLRKYKFHLCEKTPYPLQIDPKSFLTAAKGGIFLRVERL